jgi:hypothetical protein
MLEVRMGVGKRGGRKEGRMLGGNPVKTEGKKEV